jgi:hypothetical protein
LDLSDKGLMAELSEYNEAVSEDLAISDKGSKTKH